MLALVPLGSEMERVMGSIRLLYMIVLLATSNAMFHLLITLIAAYNPIHSYYHFMDECAIGFSGVLFSMIVIETSLSGAQSRRFSAAPNCNSSFYLRVEVKPQADRVLIRLEELPEPMLMHTILLAPLI
ncbi:hypothetical protein L6452_43913 [Arctium lappa]|uniref:Uncharacterized protein n=1 Tax=Arctium lappa TaxID=4217 RepID=A0ACB8XG26_ARCLA|nr:hypothetical protein L6452_43913 [Arctium lappa]